MRWFLTIAALAILAFGYSQYLSWNHHQAILDKNTTPLRLWNVPPRSLPLDRQLWDETVERFEKANPDIKVEGEEREYQPEEFITVMAGGKGPDLVKVWVGAIQTLANMDFLQPVDAYIQNWTQRDFIKPVLWESVKVGNHYYGVPADTYFLYLFYRKDLFSKAGLFPETPPATWEELARDAKLLTKRQSGQYGLGLVPKTWYFQDFVWQAGGEMIRDENGKIRSAFAEPPAVSALKFWKDLRWKYNVLEPDLLNPESELLHLFALGKVAMIFGVANQLPSLIARYKISPQTLGIAPLPAGPAGRAAHLGGEVYVVNATSSEDVKLAAWKWIEFELSPANQLWKWTRMHELKMPIFPGAFSSATEVADLPDFKMVKDVLETARFEPHVRGWPQVREMLDQDPLQEIFLNPDADPRQLLAANAKAADRDILSKWEGSEIP